MYDNSLIINNSPESSQIHDNNALVLYNNLFCYLSYFNQTKKLHFKIEIIIINSLNY